MKLKVKLDEGAHIPKRAHSDDAGLDLMALIIEGRLSIEPHYFAEVRTGTHTQIPSGYVGLLTSKSGLMRRGLTTRGTIDAGYTGEIKAIIFNDSDEEQVIYDGDKITQLVLMPIEVPEVVLCDELDETERGADGFGSTGR